MKEMPDFMWKISAVYLFQWYALFVYWQYIIPLFMKTMGFDTSNAAAQAAKMSTTYNIATVVVALTLVPLTLKYGGKRLQLPVYWELGWPCWRYPILPTLSMCFSMVFLAWMGCHDGNTLYDGI